MIQVSFQPSFHTMAAEIKNQTLEAGLFCRAEGWRGNVLFEASLKIMNIDIFML